MAITELPYFTHWREKSLPFSADEHLKTVSMFSGLSVSEVVLIR